MTESHELPESGHKAPHFHDYATDLAESQADRGDAFDFKAFLSQIDQAREGGDAAALQGAVRAALVEAISSDTREAGLVQPRREELRQLLVARGLAAEYGAILEEAGSSSPYAVSTADRQLVDLATGPSPNLIGSYDLAPKDWLALATVQTEPMRQNELLYRSLGSYVSESALMQGRVPDITGHIQSAEQLNPDVLPPLLNMLRRSRDVAGHFADDPIKAATDASIFEFLAAGRGDIAQQLITPSGHEPKQLQIALEQLKMPEAQKKPLLDQAVAIHEQKQQAFSREMSHRGIDQALTRDILGHVNDPESALAVPPASWQHFGELSDRYQRTLIFGADLEPFDAKVEAVNLLNKYQLEDHTGDIRRSASRMPPEARENYVKQLAGALRAAEGATPGDWSLLGRFQNPQEALSLATSLFPPEGKRTHSATDLYVSLVGNLRTGNLPIQLDQDQVSFLRQARQAVDALKGNDADLVGIASAVMRADVPADRRAEYLHCLKTLQEFPDGQFGLQALSGAENPTSITATWEKYGQRIADSRFRDAFIDEIRQAADPEAYAVSLFDRVMPALAAHNASVDKISLRNVLALARVPGSPEHLVAELATELRISSQIHSVVEGGVQSAIDSVKDLGSKPLPERPNPPAEKDIDPMGRLTELRSAMAALDLPPAYINDLCASWMSFNGVMHYSRQKKKMVTEFTPDDASAAADMSAEAYLSQYRALKEYVDKFGTKEAEQTYRIFGTTNFLRMSADQLHHQLERWQDPSEPVNNLQVTAKSDHNGFFQDAGRQAFKQLGERGTFCFEAGSSYELARAAVRVGDRERAAARDPLQRQTPITVVVAAHGEPLSLALGYKRNREMQVATKNGIAVSENLSAADYAQATSARDRLEIANLMAQINRHQEQGSQEPVEQYLLDMNTFHRHLGRNFRLILKACLANAVPSAANPWIRNISERMAYAHDTHVEASEHSIYGMSIEADGRTMFSIYDDATKQQISVPAQIVSPGTRRKFDTAA